MYFCIVIPSEFENQSMKVFAIQIYFLFMFLSTSFFLLLLLLRPFIISEKAKCNCRTFNQEAYICIFLLCNFNIYIFNMNDSIHFGQSIKEHCNLVKCSLHAKLIGTSATKSFVPDATSCFGSNFLSQVQPFDLFQRWFV